MFPGRIDEIAMALSDSESGDNDSDEEYGVSLRKILKTPPRSQPYQPLQPFQSAPSSAQKPVVPASPYVPTTPPKAPPKKPRKTKTGPDAVPAPAPATPTTPTAKRGKKQTPPPVIEVEVVNGQNDIAYLPINVVKDVLKKHNYHPGVIDAMPEWYIRALLRDLDRSRNGPSLLSGKTGGEDEEKDMEAAMKISDDSDY